MLIGENSKPGGLNLSQRGLYRDSQSRRWQKVSLVSWENLDNFKKLVSTIEKSRFCLDTTILTQLNLNKKVSILKISTEKKNNLVSIILTSFKSWSWHIEKYQSRFRLVSTVETPGLEKKYLNFANIVIQTNRKYFFL